MMKRLTYMNPFSKAWRYLLVLLLLAPVAIYAQDDTDDDDLEEVEGFTVVGSRISRADLETVSPVINLTRESLEQTGFTTAGDAIRALPIVSGQNLTSIDAGTSFTPGVSSVNLRGLGNNNTLALINGRRVAPFATPGFNGFQNVVDLSSIPSAALDSIQILKDGASALYGSDAVAGVINVSLAKEYDGLTTELSLGNTIDSDSFEWKVTAIGGAQSGKASLIYVVDFSERNPMFAREVDWMDESNSPSFANVTANATPDFVTFYTLSGMPDSYVQNAMPGIEESKNLTPDDFDEGITYYNYQEVTGFIPKVRSAGFYTRLSYQVNPNLEAYLETSFRRVETEINAAPTPLFSWNESVDLNLPPENPYNPFGEEMFIGWRMIEYGSRFNIVQADTPRIVAGLTGDIGDSGWTFDSGLLFTESTVTNENAGTVFDRRLETALREGVDFDGELVWANPFGKNDPRIIDYVVGNNPTKDSIQLWSFDASANGDLLDLETGVISAAVGVEYRYEELTSIRTNDNRTGNIVGGSETTSVFGDRDIKSLYAELSIPIYELAEFQVAGRYEDYSDFGDTSKPKIGVKVTPVDGLLLRASFGQSFRAPDLPYLYSSGSVSFTSNFYADPLRPNDPETQIKTVGGGNPTLQPEETDSYYLGAQLDVGQMVESLDGLVIEIDYWEFEQTDVFGRFTGAQIIQNAGDPFFDQFIVRAERTQADIDAGLPGRVLFVETDWQNLDEQSTSGIDLAALYTLRTEDMGEWRFKVEATYVDEFVYSTLDFDEDGNEITTTQFFEGTWSQPHWRANGTIAWNYGDWAASLFVDFVGEYEQLDGDDQDAYGNVKAYWRFNPQVAFSGFWDTTITVGVRNVFDEAPPLDLGDVTNVNNSLHNAEPRFVYVRFAKDW